MVEDKLNLERKWALWEMWQTGNRDKHKNWTDLMQEVATFDTLYDFWQAWAHLPHSNPS